jgi:bacterioferritin-associated ferredoxin
MILCLCRDIRDADVDRVVAAGARTLDDVMLDTGACSGCGTCKEAVAARIEHAAQRQACASPSPDGSPQR